MEGLLPFTNPNLKGSRMKLIVTFERNLLECLQILVIHYQYDVSAKLRD